MSMSPCIGCQAGCCRSFAVPVTGADLYRLRDEQGLEFAEVACRWEDREGLIASGTAPHFFFADEPQTPFVICLRHEASETFPDVTRCRFLVESDPAVTGSYCGIYNQRPLACRTFPTKLHASGLLAEVHSIPASGRANDPNPAFKLCSRPWRADEIHPIESLQNLVLIRFEMQFFQQVADVWNQTRGDFELFPDFLHEVYSRRVIAPQTQTGNNATPAAATRKQDGKTLRAA